MKSLRPTKLKQSNNKRLINIFNTILFLHICSICIFNNVYKAKPNFNAFDVIAFLNENNFGNAIFNRFLPIMQKDSFVEWGTFRQVIITNMEFSPEGRLTNCKIRLYYVNKNQRVTLDDQEHEYIKVLKQAVKDLYAEYMEDEDD